jgi:hypothetical protein
MKIPEKSVTFPTLGERGYALSAYSARQRRNASYTAA